MITDPITTSPTPTEERGAMTKPIHPYILRDSLFVIQEERAVSNLRSGCDARYNDFTDLIAVLFGKEDAPTRSSTNVLRPAVRRRNCEVHNSRGASTHQPELAGVELSKPDVALLIDADSGRPA